MKKINLIKALLNLYLFLFIFTMINREFRAFGIDIRFFYLPIGIFLICYGVLHKKITKTNANTKKYANIIIFYIWVLISNISWIWNGLEISFNFFINEIILLLNVLICIIVLWQYNSDVTQRFINKCIVFSVCILALSMILVSIGYSAEQIFASSDEPLIYYSNVNLEHNNLLGWNYRPAGYASDPNYATLLLLIGCISTLKLKSNKTIKSVILFYLGFCMALSCSKTIIVALFLGLIYIGIVKIFRDRTKFINFLIIAVLILSVIIIPNINSILRILPTTMSIRISMWDEAFDLFLKSPILGNGITSFRSYYEISHWYVQCHCTYLQVLSETGIIGIVLLTRIIYNLLKERKYNVINLFITFVYLIFMLDFETIALQFVVYLFCMCDIGGKKNEKEKSIVFY